MAPALFSEIGKQAKDLLSKDYNFDNKLTVSILSDAGMGLVATGVKRDRYFVGDLSTQYKSGNATVDVKFDIHSNVSTTVTVREFFPFSKAALSFNIPDHKPGKVDVEYLHPHVAITSCVGLTPTPYLEGSAAIGTKEVSLGGEVVFDSSSASFIKCNAGIGIIKPDFSASVILVDKGDTVKASYVHMVNPLKGATVAAELSHRFSTYEGSFSIGTSYALDPFTVVKARFSDNGMVSALCQRQWRPQSLITFCAEYDPKFVDAVPRFGLALALKP